MSIPINPKERLILTFGYGNRKDYNLFLDYLKEFNVICVVDVRLRPKAWTKKWYGDVLEKVCASRKIQYVSKSALGNLSGNSQWIPPESEEAEEALSEVVHILEVGNVLLLCAERDPSKCHRSEIASRLQEMTYAEVMHLN
jgi:uncharacterized protein (DUF488 family)